MPYAKTRVNVEVAPPIARVLLSNPPLNVIDFEMTERLIPVLLEIESRSDISTTVFQGDNRVFSAGVDIKAHLPDQIHEMLTSFHAVIRAIVASRKVTIAAVRGACLGGGAELAAVCDMVYDRQRHMGVSGDQTRLLPSGCRRCSERLNRPKARC